MSGIIDYRGVYDELIALRRWKREATTVLGYWDNAFERSGIDGQIGESKPTLMLAEVARLARLGRLIEARLNRISDHLDRAVAANAILGKTGPTIVQWLPIPICPCQKCQHGR